MSGRVSIAISPYAEESLRTLHERSLHSCRKLLEQADATALASAINQLDAPDQVLLALVYFERFDICEVAGILDTSVADCMRAHALAVFALIEQFAKVTQFHIGACTHASESL